MADAFTPLERAALDGLAWELGFEAPDLAGQIADSLPDRRRVHGPLFFTETIVDRSRPASSRKAQSAYPGPAETTTGRLGTIHVQIDHLDHPVAFQAELLNGRLIALHGDAYGRDLTAVDLTGDVVDQVFRLDANGRSIAVDRPARVEPTLEARPLRRSQEDPDPPGPTPDTLPPAVAAKAVLHLLFSKKTGAVPEAEPPPAADLALIRLGVMAGGVLLALFLIFALDFHPIFAAIPAIWLTRALLTKRGLAGIAQLVAAWRARHSIARSQG